MIRDEIKEMSTRERMILMEEIWDTLSHDDSEIKPPAWHSDIIEERLRKLEKGEAKLMSLEELKARTR